MDDNTRSNEDSVAEQRSFTNAKKNSNSVSKTHTARTVRNITNDLAPGPTTFFTLKRFLFQLPQPIIIFLAIAIFISISMTIGILTVCFTASQQSVQNCEMNFSLTTRDPLEYNYGPRSVAVGDFNNDTHLDIVVANSAADNITIFLGNGNGAFSVPIIYVTGLGSAPQMVIVGDFNNDHRLDIAVANFGTNNVGIFLGFGNGTFAHETALLTNSSRPLWINATDLNDDAALDIVIANYGTHSISVFYGYGNGSFGRSITYSTGYDSLPFAVVTGDFNNDNQLDLVTANHGTNNIGVFLSSGNNTFQNQTTFPTGSGSRPYSVVVGHFNDDTSLDIAVANYGTNNIGIFLGYGNGTFAYQTTYSTGAASPYFIGVGDFQNDHRSDLVVTNKGSNNIGVFFGYGDGTFASPEMYSTGSVSSTSVAIGDFNNDNRLDITVTNNDTNSINVLLGYDEGFAAQMTYSTGTNPSFVAVGYFNNDTALDIVVTNSYDNNVGVLLGHGNGIFGNQTTYSTGYAPRSIAVGDFNNDTRIDIVVVNYGDNNVGVLLGYGDGSFANQITYSTGNGSNPISVAIGDLNNDSRLDIAVANSGTNSVGLLFGYGNGSFAFPVMYSTGYGSYPISVAIGDLNNDTRLDIVVANLGTSNVGLFFGYGNGSFGNQITYSSGSGSRPFYVAVSDLNNDGRLDIVVVNYGNNNVGVLLGYGDGSFKILTTYSTGSQPYSVVVNYFNNDFHLDIVVVNYGDNNVSVLLGYGNGSFANQITYSTGYRPSSVAAGDFNGDTLPDIAVSNYYSNDVSVLLRYKSGALAKEVALASGGGARLRCAISGDLDNDGQLDIIVANYGTNDIGVLFGYGNGTFENQRMLASGSNSLPFLIAFGDFNGDNQMDIFVANSGDNNIGVILGYGNRSFANERTYAVSSRLEFIIVGDLNNDRRADIVVVYEDTDDVDILLAYNTGSFANQITYSTGSAPRSVAVGDFNNDTRLDIVVTNSYDNSISIFLGYGNGSFASQTSYSTDSGSYPISVAIGDLNNDTRLDIVVASLGASNVGLFFGYGNGSFASQTTYPTGYGSNPISVAIGNLNNDTRLDIVVANSGTDSISVLLGYGDGSFAARIMYSTGVGSRPFFVAIGDLNNDTRLDIVVANSGTDNVCLFFGYGNGSFGNQITYSTGSGSRPSSLAVGDFNGDTYLDIVVTKSYSNNVGVFLGYGNGSFADQMTYSTGLNPISVSVGDLNNDTRLDIVVANYLGNTISVLLGYGDGFFANQMIYFTDYHPSSIVVGDLNNNIQSDMVVVNNGDNNIGVFLGYISFGFLKYRTLTTGNGSRPQAGALGDFNNDDHVDVIITNSGVDSVGIFLGYGNGSFTKQTTYAAGSNPLSVAVGDFNNDTRLDIVVANFDSNNVGVLLGYGNGSFANQITYSTHFDPQFVTVGDFNSDSFLDIIVAIPDTSNIGILLGYGNGTFTELVNFPLDYGSLPFSVVIGDFNNDRKLDFGVVNEGTDDLQILLQTC